MRMTQEVDINMFCRRIVNSHDYKDRLSKHELWEGWALHIGVTPTTEPGARVGGFTRSHFLERVYELVPLLSPTTTVTRLSNGKCGRGWPCWRLNPKEDDE